MENEYGLGEIVAERELVARNEEGQTREVRVWLGMPKPFPDAPYGDYYCPFQIKGVGNEKVQRVGGVDAFQALQLAMVGIGSQLEYLKQTYKLQLSWLEGSGDLGFPIGKRRAESEP